MKGCLLSALGHTGITSFTERTGRRTKKKSWKMKGGRENLKVEKEGRKENNGGEVKEGGGGG